MCQVQKIYEAVSNLTNCSCGGICSSTGNAAAAGMRTYIFVPSRAPKGKVARLMTFGAIVISVQGSYEDTFNLSK